MDISAVADSVIYIQFDNSFILPGFVSLYWADSCFFANTREGVLKYDIKGCFLQKIGGLGDGPKEYPRYSYRCIMDKSNEVIYIYVYSEQKLLSYSFTGKFIKSVQVELPDDVKRLVEKKAISMSHARVLSKMDDEEKVNELAKKIVTEDMSVRDLERLSQDVKSDVIVKGTSSSKKGFDHKYRMYENIIMDSLDTKVRVSKKKIEIYFDGVEELEEILSKMNVKVEEE